MRAHARGADRLRHNDALDRDIFDALFELRLRARSLWRGGMGVLAGVASFGGGGGGASSARDQTTNERVHVVPSTDQTVRLGVFDSTLPNVVDIDSGDVVVFPDTWSHFLNRLQPDVTIEGLAQMRRDNPGRGPHSIIGPVGVRGAESGDMLAIEVQRLVPGDWGATFVNPSNLDTGTLAERFPTGQVRYLALDAAAGRAEFLPGIDVPLGPFQGTLGVAPAQGGVVSSVPPGPHAGNIDLRDLVEGTVLFIPVWQPTAKLFTGDSHAAQGDGEVNNQAIESWMREVRLRVTLHKAADWAWPFAETSDAWIAMGIDADLNEAFRITTRNVIDFLHRKAGLSELDAYSLASIAISFRVTQFVNQTRGVHALIPKAIFSRQRRQSIGIV